MARILGEKPVDFDFNKTLREIRLTKGEHVRAFIRDKKLSVGIQLLKKGEKYGEPAHPSGEVYYILKGNARMRVYSKNKKSFKDFRAIPGKAIFVPSRAIHNFENVTKDLVFLFIFPGLDDVIKKKH